MLGGAYATTIVPDAALGGLMLPDAAPIDAEREHAVGVFPLLPLTRTVKTATVAGSENVKSLMLTLVHPVSTKSLRRTLLTDDANVAVRIMVGDAVDALPTDSVTGTCGCT